MSWPEKGGHSGRSTPRNTDTEVGTGKGEVQGSNGSLLSLKQKSARHNIVRNGY